MCIHKESVLWLQGVLIAVPGATCLLASNERGREGGEGTNDGEYAGTTCNHMAASVAGTGDYR